MASRPVMVLGNLASIALAIAGILQAVSWTIAGAMILAILSITTLTPTRLSSGTGTSRSAAKKTVHSTSAETKPVQVKIQQPVRSSSQTRSDFQKAMTPKITPPKTVPTSVTPAKPGQTRPGGPKQEAIRPVPVGPTPTAATTVKPSPPKLDPNTRIVAKGDYATYDVELGQRMEVTCEVNATAPVNVYLMDADNLNSLDLGEEFWSESGEEGVMSASLHFVAPQNGKWFLVIENLDNREVQATANIRKSLAKTGPVKN
ncbi:MAG TPA: hypothetical protein VE955_11855 [Candidatus Dormibacteraeota bacterium]|nr:hypothetical protein [Candidatus Dormibacteraeota bacterium]